MTKVKVLELQNELTILFKEWIERLTVSGVRLEEEQNALREHIDKEFIDINAYMMELVEDIEKQRI